jgi:hypothetical protein
MAAWRKGRDARNADRRDVGVWLGIELSDKGCKWSSGATVTTLDEPVNV